MLCRCDLNDLWLISSRTCFYFVLLPVELKSNRTWNRRITAYYSTRIFLYFTVIACVNIFLFVYISCAFLWEAGFDRRLPFLAYRHLANRYYYFCCLLQCFIIMYQQVAVRCCPVAIVWFYLPYIVGDLQQMIVRTSSISFASFPEPGHITAIIRPAIWL